MNRKPRALGRFLHICVFVLCAAGATTAEIEIPDIETRIRNTGNAVPESALPPLPQPKLVPIPADLYVAEDPPPAAEIRAAEESKFEVVQAPEPEPVIEPSLAPRHQSVVSGSASFGAGYPGVLNASVRVERSGLEDGLFPFGAGFSWKSSDGYGTASAGEGFFDREVRFSLDAGDSESGEGRWLSLEIGERTDGMQQLNPEYYSVTRQDLSWSVSPFSSRSLRPLGGGYVGASVLFSGDVMLFSGDRPVQTGQPTNAILDESAYSLLPSVSVFWERGGFYTGLTGFYAYDSTTRRGEVHTGGGELAARYTAGSMVYSASLTAVLDSANGVLVPFVLSVMHDTPGFPDAEDPVQLLFRAEGGLSSGLRGPAELLGEEPFSWAGFATASPADWFAEAETGLELVTGFSFRARAGWKASAFNRGVLLGDGTRLANGLARVALFSRDRLETAAEAGWTGAMASASAGYSGIWLDETHFGVAHRLILEGRVFAPGDEPQWNAEVSASFPLDSGELPEVSVQGSVRPLRDVSLSLGWKDALPAVTGKNRFRNGLYRTACGELTLSAQVDF